MMEGTKIILKGKINNLIKNYGLIIKSCNFVSLGHSSLDIDQLQSISATR